MTLADALLHSVPGVRAGKGTAAQTLAAIHLAWSGEPPPAPRPHPGRPAAWER